MVKSRPITNRDQLLLKFKISISKTKSRVEITDYFKKKMEYEKVIIKVDTR